MKTNKYWELLYEDHYLLVVNKSAGFLTLPDRFDANLPSLSKELQKLFPQSMPVHRLDRYTSGVILFAKDTETHRYLSKCFEQRTIKKTYHAIVQGVPIYQSGKIDMPIAKVSGKNKAYISVADGKPSMTSFKIAENYKAFSLLMTRPETGRLHQIRVHLQHLGTPLLVDPIYGGRDAFYLSEIKKKYVVRKGKSERPLISRQTLHASSISFEHPSTGDPVEFLSPMPKDMRATIAQLRKRFVE